MVNTRRAIYESKREGMPEKRKRRTTTAQRHAVLSPEDMDVVQNDGGCSSLEPIKLKTALRQTIQQLSIENPEAPGYMAMDRQAQLLSSRNINRQIVSVVDRAVAQLREGQVLDYRDAARSGRTRKYNVPQWQLQQVQDIINQNAFGTWKDMEGCAAISCVLQQHGMTVRELFRHMRRAGLDTRKRVVQDVRNPQSSSVYRVQAAAAAAQA